MNEKTVNTTWICDTNHAFYINVDWAVSVTNRASAMGILARDTSGLIGHCRNIMFGYVSPLFAN